MVRKTFSPDEILKIQKHYKNGLSCDSIGKLFGVSKTPISRVLKDLGILKKSKSDGKKIVLTESQKIKKMYCDEFKNAYEISQKLKLTKSFIDKYLNTVNYRRNKSEAMRILKTGKKLSEKIKKNMKIAQHKFNQSGNKKINWVNENIKKVEIIVVDKKNNKLITK